MEYPAQKTMPPRSQKTLYMLGHIRWAVMLFFPLPAFDQGLRISSTKKCSPSSNSISSPLLDINPLAKYSTLIPPPPYIPPLFLLEKMRERCKKVDNTISRMFLVRRPPACCFFASTLFSYNFFVEIFLKKETILEILFLIHFLHKSRVYRHMKV